MKNCSTYKLKNICSFCKRKYSECLLSNDGVEDSIFIALKFAPIYMIKTAASEPGFLTRNGDWLKEIVEIHFPQHLELLEKYLILK